MKKGPKRRKSQNQHLNRCMKPERLIGLQKDEARSQCERQGYKMRIVMEDGKASLGSMEYLPNRINVVVRNDKIQKIQGIG